MRKALRDAIVREAKAAEAIVTAAETEDRDLTDVERDTITGHLSKAAEFKKRGEDEDAMRAQFAGITDGIELDAPADLRPDPELVAAGAKGGSKGRPAKAGSVGAAFVKSDAYKDMLASVPDGRFSEKARVHSAPYGIKSLITGTSETSAGIFVENDQRGLMDQTFYQTPLTVRSLFSTGQTTSDTIEYVKVNSVTNNAAPVAEATASGVIDGVDITPVEGGLKPESGMDWIKDTEPIRTIAHWMPITKRALADAPMVRSMIDTFLRYGLEEELESQTMTGNGLGENFTGLANVSGVQTQAAPAGAQTILETTRMARRKVRIGGRAVPTAYAMNPIDWETIELTRNSNDDYYGGGPFAMTTPRLWGLPVVESEAVPQGTSYVADWRYGMIVDREQASVQVSDQHADFFTRNLVAILAEMRAGFVVFRPQAFVRIAWA